jgi:hypothetical protein
MVIRSISRSRPFILASGGGRGVHNTDGDPEDILKIGCCGAYCKTCRALADGSCLGCKLGYKNGERDINKAKCRMKLCCFRDRGLNTCADCPELVSCVIMREFFAKKGYKYSKYKQSLEFIKENGYEGFIEAARDWKGPYGRL